MNAVAQAEQAAFTTARQKYIGGSDIAAILNINP